MFLVKWLENVRMREAVWALLGFCPQVAAAVQPQGQVAVQPKGAQPHLPIGLPHLDHLRRAKKKLVIMESEKNLDDKCNEKKSNWSVPYLVEDIIFNIFTRLDARDVHELRYGCKDWYKVISSSHFIVAHLRQSNPGLIAIPDSMTIPAVARTRYIHPNILQITEKEVSVRSLTVKCDRYVQSACNGLLLLEDMISNLWVSNPVTGQILTLPPCIQRSESVDIMRGITFDDSTGEYKVVSFVFSYKIGSLGCEMLALGSSTWKWLSSPFQQLFKLYGDEDSISIGGVFHCMFRSTSIWGTHGSAYVVSFDTVEEKFHKSTVPFCCWRCVLLEIDSCPSFVVSNVRDFSRCSMWALKDLVSGKWEKQYNIAVNYPPNWKFSPHSRSLRVVASLENARFLIIRHFGRYGIEYHVYDVQLQLMRCFQLDTNTGCSFLTHVESLVPCP